MIVAFCIPFILTTVVGKKKLTSEDVSGVDIKQAEFTETENIDSEENKVDTVAENFQAPITGITKKLSDIEMILPKEKEAIVKFNDNKTDFPKLTVHELFEKQVLKHPDKKAVVFEDKYLTYKELNEKANRLARFFIKNGLSRCDVASIMID